MIDKSEVSNYFEFMEALESQGIKKACIWTIQTQAFCIYLR